MKTLISIVMLFQIPIIFYAFTKVIYFYSNGFSPHVYNETDAALIALRYGGIFESLITMLISIGIVLAGYAILKNLDK